MSGRDRKCQPVQALDALMRALSMPDEHIPSGT
jgi:hypothetical protein